ncbi:MAG: hypothetical protein PHE09_14420 [Oscillospiraceae bacterium]|nr:hypothetical protein [Oscillospiraceae bacterium]
MTRKKRATLIKQAYERCKLGLAAQRHRERLRRLVNEKAHHTIPHKCGMPFWSFRLQAMSGSGWSKRI